MQLFTEYLHGRFKKYKRLYMKYVSYFSVYTTIIDKVNIKKIRNDKNIIFISFQIIEKIKYFKMK